ncbi:MAG: hypothetical protein Q4F03_04795 [Eubacteriales bacterium]|nr:hypothetical protein [Eubacteriales bacterium]
MMNNTIQKMKDNGMYDRMVKFFAEKKVENEGKDFTRKNVERIIEFEILARSEHDFVDTLIQDSIDLGISKLVELIMNAVEEQVKVYALNDVDPDVLFEKATGCKHADLEIGDSGFKKSNEGKIKDAVVGGFLKFVLNNILGK